MPHIMIIQLMIIALPHKVPHQIIQCCSPWHGKHKNIIAATSDNTVLVSVVRQTSEDQWYGKHQKIKAST